MPPSSERAAEFPVGGSFLADALDKRGYTCRIICDKSLEEIYEELDKHVDENTVGIGLSVVSTLIFKDSIGLSHEIKRKFPDVPLLWGGQAIIGQKEQMLEFEPVDFVVVGNGEDAIPDLLDALTKKKDYTQIVGLGYTKTGSLAITYFTSTGIS